MVALDASKRMSDLFTDGDKLGKAIAAAMTDPAVVALITDQKASEC
jgi:DNA-binding transcriptional regulator LsrR (DeoR family)